MRYKKLGERQINFELLRIVSILLIVAYHCNLHLNYNEDGIIYHGAITINQLILNVFGIWGQVGVNCFVFISAYFLVETSNIKAKNIYSILLQTSFWGIIVMCITWIFCVTQLQIMVIIKEIFGVFLNQYWFITAYCLLYLTIPSINRILKKLESSELRKLIVLLTCIVPFYKTVYSDAPIGNYLWLVYLYILMAYLKRNDNNFFERHRKEGFLLSALFCIILVTIVMFLAYVLHLGELGKLANHLVHIGSLFMLIVSIFLFYVFKNLHFTKHHNIVKLLASTTLGIYLIHENFIFYYNTSKPGFWWDYLFNVGNKYSQYDFIVFYAGAVILTFLICSCLDLLRYRLIEEPLFKTIPVKILFDKTDKLISKYL